MVFASNLFLFLFLPLALGIYLLAPFLPLRNGVLLASSLLFYAWGEGSLILVMLAVIAANYGFGRWIDATTGQHRRKACLALAVTANLALIGYYKYASFLLGNLNRLLAVFGVDALSSPPVHLPIGISFFTFQALGYVIDVYRRDVPAERNPFNLALYVALFPQLIAGPIVRYKDVAAEIRTRQPALGDFAAGVERFIIGLAGKVLVANSFARIADRVFALPIEEVSTRLILLGAVSYSIQIYFDFAGYSHMAIGLGRMLGFHFLENFSFPYSSRSMTEFWRRWHISLSTWFRDYLYLPLGGNRCPPTRRLGNLVIVFLLCGLWHGAAWHFVAWGLFHGFFLVLERAWLGGVLARLPSLVGHAYVLATVLVGWILFRADSIGRSFDYLATLAGLSAHSSAPFCCYSELLTPEVVVLGVIAALTSFPIGIGMEGAKESADLAERRPFAGILGEFAVAACLGLMLLASAAYLAAGTFNPFIYYRF